MIADAMQISHLVIQAHAVEHPAEVLSRGLAAIREGVRRICTQKGGADGKSQLVADVLHLHGGMRTHLKRPCMCSLPCKPCPSRVIMPYGSCFGATGMTAEGQSLWLCCL